MVRKKLLGVKTVLLSLAAVATLGTSITAGGIKAYASEIPMKSSTEIVDQMGLGWNLGNTLDSEANWLVGTGAAATDFEKAWGNPVTTKEMIDKVKEGGFKTIRIPVTWLDHIGAAPEYTIDEAWMDRVQEVVNYAIDDGMYVILNTHHDSDWIIPSYEKEDEVTDKLVKVWTQIADRFKDYDDHLILEAFNEVREKGAPEEWNGGTAEGRDVVNHYADAVVKTIRESGGNNDERSIMLQTYGASGSSNAINDFKLPDSKNLIVSLHSYSPYHFAMNCYDEWQVDKWGTDADKANLENELQYYYDSFVSKGIPLVMGEMGSTNKNNTHDRAELAKYYIKYAKERHIPCIWWDNGAHGEGAENFGLFDRYNLNWYFPEVHNALVNSYNSTSFK